MSPERSLAHLRSISSEIRDAVVLDPAGRRLAGSRRIYIAEINGHALGGGLEIALACDLRFAGAGEYWLGLPEVTLGLLPGNGGTQRLSALVGASKAMELMILGTRLRPEQALQLGVVNRQFPAPRWPTTTCW